MERRSKAVDAREDKPAASTESAEVKAVKQLATKAKRRLL